MSQAGSPSPVPHSLLSPEPAIAHRKDQGLGSREQEPARSRPEHSPPPTAFAPEAKREPVRHSQRHNICVGCVHSDAQGVFPFLVGGVLVGASFQEETHLPVQKKSPSCKMLATGDAGPPPLPQKRQQHQGEEPATEGHAVLCWIGWFSPSFPKQLPSFSSPLL